MTTKEMDNVLQEFCVAHGELEDCDKCCIKGLCDLVHGDFERHPNICKEAYETVQKVANGDNDSKVNHPSHYNQGGMECIDEMELIFGTRSVMEFCKCNAWKYRYRANQKGGKEDLEKANWYINKCKELDDKERALYEKTFR